MNLATKTSLRNLRVGDPIAIIYVPSATLARYGAGVAFNGTFMVFDVVPFYETKPIWIGKCNEGRCLDIENIKRAYSKCLENAICPGFVGSSQESALMFLQNVTGVIEGSSETEAGADNLHYIKDMVDRACALFRDGQHQELEILTNDNEIRDEISKTIILHDENWEGLRCRICPSCAATIPTCFCVCLECDAQLILLTERFYVNVNSDDDDDDHEPNVSGDARRAQEEANDNTAAQERDDGMEDEPDDDEMGTQGYTSGNASEEEETEEEYRDNEMTARDIINSQQLAICLDEPREAQYMAGFIALQMSRCSRLAPNEQLTPRLWGLPHVHTTMTCRATPTSLGLIGLVSSYHLLRRRFLNLRVFDQELSIQSRTATNMFAFRRPNARTCTSTTNCGVRRLSSMSPRKK